MTDDTTEAERNDGIGSLGSGARTLLLVGFSFAAGYLVGRTRRESDLREELEEEAWTDEGPMEIEIEDADEGTTSESIEIERDEENEGAEDDEEDEE